MKDALEMKINGLKCDNPKCDYIDMSVNVEDYEKWVNVKCPKCGEILLTEADYRNTKFLLGMVRLANKIFPKRKDDEEVAIMSVDMDGSGDMKFNIKDSE